MDEDFIRSFELKVDYFFFSVVVVPLSLSYDYRPPLLRSCSKAYQ